MTQTEIQFFWPLTEQINLDLDFKPSQDYEEQKRKEMWANSVTSGQHLIAGNGIATWATVASNQSLSNLMEFRPSPKSVGYWEVSPELHYYVTKEPNWLVKKMTKFMLGWKWGNKN